MTTESMTTTKTVFNTHVFSRKSRDFFASREHLFCCARFCFDVCIVFVAFVQKKKGGSQRAKWKESMVAHAGLSKIKTFSILFLSTTIELFAKSFFCACRNYCIP